METQKEICMEFIESFNQKGDEKIDIAGFYHDAGKSGANFRRDGFKDLIHDISSGDINCVVVKDLSRFGRNYLEAGNYIEKIFPFSGVRFIAVTDGIDTGREGNIDYISLEIKNLVNDMYAKDFSVKSKAGLQQRRLQGSYTGGPSPYGYRTVWEGKIRKLVPDENVAGIIGFIFREFVKEKKYKAVTNSLNQMRVNPPVIYRETKQVFCPAGSQYKEWDKNAVIRILKSRTYTGVLEQGKTSITMKDERTRVHKDKADWVVKENTHKALVSKELFGDVACIIKQISRKRKENCQ